VALEAIPDVTTLRPTWPPVLGTRPLASCLPAPYISIAYGCILTQIRFPHTQKCNTSVTSTLERLLPRLTYILLVFAANNTLL
jgi:hypothetical protein